ncbi:hypothetical protein DMH04_25295 [Kibdelosporangium aridum]|uniref:Alpha/beta hydrolase family protein n=1 Tax=Kibdelosporangium aridum TaxID=2030 RepID=A0A428Z607_KIBAR|nr:hypothetical protein DMH04_25295 [Kibdelosporangium aridum]
MEYRRIGEHGPGFPGTFLDVPTATDKIAELGPKLETSRVLVVGHSAGGHLAGWAHTAQCCQRTHRVRTRRWFRWARYRLRASSASRRAMPTAQVTT